MIRIVVHEPLHDLLLVGHDALVEGRVSVVVSRVCPTFLVKKSGNGLNVAPNHLLVNRVDLFLQLKQKRGDNKVRLDICLG